MKTNPPSFLACLTICVLSHSIAVADTLVFLSGRAVSGRILQTNGDDILLLTPYAAFNYSRARLKEIKTESEENPRSSTDRVSDFSRAILNLSKQLWATNLTPIPATVIDKGILRNVPYSSFQCGENYEVNIYGDLDHPAGIEIGIYKTMDDDKLRQNNCIQFVSDLFSRAADKALVQSLETKKDVKILDDLTFEITPTSADDSYGGWWVSIYSEKQLSLARASDSEMKQISVSKADAAKQSSESDPSQWSAGEWRLARVSASTTITFTNKDGNVFSNATVRIHEPGVSVICETADGSAGVVKLADLPESLRNRFGYDPEKAKAYNASQKEKQIRWQQSLAAQRAQLAKQSEDATSTPSIDDSSYQSSGNYSGAGSVYVHGYTRSNRTYVSGYTRSR